MKNGKKNELRDVGQFRKEENRKMLNSYIGRKKNRQTATDSFFYK